MSKKVEGGGDFFAVICFPSIFFIGFLAVSMHEELRKHHKTFSKIKPEKLKTQKIPQKK
jgi:hypothetical protein